MKSDFLNAQKTKAHREAGFGFFGRGDRIRTCDLYVPNVALYQTELHPDASREV